MADPAAPAPGGYRRGRWVAAYLGLAAAATFVVSRLPRESRAELATLDRRLAAAPRPRDPRVRVVAIDDESFKKFKRIEGYRDRRRWPWPTTAFAEVATNLFDRGAAVVAFDLLTFDTPSAPAYAAEDAALAAVAAAHPGRLVLATRYDRRVVDGATREEWSLPIRPLREVCGRGYVNALQGPDGVVRWVAPRRDRMGMFEEDAFSLAVARAAAAARGAPFTAAVEGGRLAVGTARLALDRAGRLLIPVSGEGAGAATPFWRALTGEGLGDGWRDAVVLVGPTTVDLHDRHPAATTALTGEPVDGVALQADLVSAMFRGSDLRPAGPGLAAAALVAGGLCGFALAAFAPPALGLAGLALAVGAGYLLAGLALARAGLWVEVARPAAAAALAFVAVLAARLAGEERRRQQVRQMFSAYVSGEVLEFLEENPGAFRLTGERRDVTVFFSDVQGFTDMSETVTPDVLASILNRYFTPMSDLVMQDDGYVDKYIGDCIMAVFGTPQPLEDHARRCCASVLKQRAALARLNDELEAEFGKTLNFRVGINSGAVSAGNMGSESRFEYTVMGDVVNLASRLEGANKNYGTRIMVGQNTYEATKDEFEYRFLDLLRVKGKLEPVRVYELLDHAGALPAARAAALRRFEAGWEKYRDQDWDGAARDFEAVLAADPDDGPARVYLERVAAYRESPPPPDWGGVYVMTSK